MPQSNTNSEKSKGAFILFMLWFTVISLATSIASNALIMKIPMACNEYQIHSRKSFTFENSLADWLSFSFAIV